MLKIIRGYACLALLFCSLAMGVGAAQAQEEDVSMSGWLSAVIVDPITMLDKPVPGSKKQNPVLKHFLTDDQGQTVEVHISPELLKSVGGYQKLRHQKVKIGGKKDVTSGQITVSNIEPDLAAAGGSGGTEITTSLAPSSGSTPWATILCRFGDMTDITPHDVPWFNTLMGNSYPGMDHFWRENSYDQMNLVGSQVYGWYNLPSPKSIYCPDNNGNLYCDMDEIDIVKIANDCAAVADADVYFPNFSGINFMYNDWLGAAQGGNINLNLDGQTRNYSVTLMPPWGYEIQRVLAHEMGHGYGLAHSSGAYGETYDSQWDFMSGGGAGKNIHPQYGYIADHTISFHKDRLGWIPPGRKYTALPGETRQIFIERLALPLSTTDYLMAQIPFTNRTDLYYTVEARRYAGYDLELPGEAVIINYVHGTVEIGGIAQIVDSDTTNTNPNDAGAMWTVGETFTDAARGISVTVDSMTSTGYYVTISNLPPPDLVVVDLITTPSSLSIGGNNIVKVLVRNLGGEMTTSSTVGVYLPTDPTITIQDNLLGTLLLPAPLPAGGESWIDMSVSFPSTMVEGTYYLGAIADIYNELPEIDETNNFTWTSIYASDLIAPSAPTNLRAVVVSPSRIDLNWTAATDNVGVASYDIERCTGKTCTNFAPLTTVTGTSYSNMGLAASTTYKYRVRAKDITGNYGAYSSIVKVTTLADTQAPGAPTNLSATAVGLTQANLSWDAATDNVGVTQYKIERCLASSCTFAQIATVSGVTLSYNDTTLSQGVIYSYRVRAMDAANLNGPYSNTATLPDTTPPTVLSGLVAMLVSGTQINLSWIASTDNMAVTGYRIQRCSGSATCADFITIGTSTGPSYSNTGLFGLTIYRYQVQAYDAAGNNSAFSSPVNATTPEAVPPSAPTNLTATGGRKKVDLAWTASTDNVGVAGYKIERCTGSTCTNFTQVATTTAISYSNTWLVAGTTYRFQIRAYDAAGNNSGYSNIPSATAN